MPEVLRRLRRKVVAVTTGLVGVVVILIAITYSASVYVSTMNEIDMTLSHSKEPRGEKAPREDHPPSGQSLDLDDSGWMPPGGSGVEQGELRQEKPAPQDTEQESSDRSNMFQDDQMVDLFHGKTALSYSVDIDAQGTILKNNSPAIAIDADILQSAIDSLLMLEEFPPSYGVRLSGKFDSELLYYQAEQQNGVISLSLTDADPFDRRIQNAILVSLGLSGLAVVLTFLISLLLSRLFLRPVKDAWVKQRRFIADASHELKTPLTIIMANTEIIRSESSATVERQEKWLAATFEECKRMQGLVADLLLLAQMDDEQSDTGSALIKKVDFSSMVENAYIGFEAVAYERNLTLTENITDRISVSGVDGRIERLAFILIDNACKYTEPGGFIEVSLTVEQKSKDGSLKQLVLNEQLEQSEKVAVLKVFNTGSPMENEHLNQLFDRFYRVDESRSDDIPGYGLGLSIAESIVKESGGHIKAENVSASDSQEAGVAFTARIPCCHEKK